MEEIQNVSTQNTTGWFDKRCRHLVHSVFSKLSYGQLELVEASHSHFFPEYTQSDNKTDIIKGKIHIHDMSVYKDFVKGGSIGVAEAFIAGKWSSPNLTNVIRIFAKAQQQTDKLESKKSFFNKIKNAITHWQNRNTQSGSKKNILAHYDLGNELYTRFLDPQMMYSSAIYPSPTTSLEYAQLYKLKTICERLSLTEDDHLLEIGTGWGGLAIYAAQNFGCKVTTTTISDAQYEYAEQRVKELNLEGKITLLKKDYRDLTGTYDKVVSIEMIEAVGYEFLPSFFKQCNDRLKEGGKLLASMVRLIRSFNVRRRTALSCWCCSCRGWC